MRGGLIIWSQEKLDQLRESIRHAEENGDRNVGFFDGKSNHFRGLPTHVWSLQEARERLYEGQGNLDAAPPARDYPENREGEEP